MNKCYLISFTDEELNIIRALYVSEIEFVGGDKRYGTYADFLRDEIKQIDEELRGRK